MPNMQQEETTERDYLQEFERLTIVANEEFGSLGKLAERIGKRSQTFYVYKHREKKFGKDLMHSLEFIAGINPRYIMYGEEPKMISTPDTAYIDRNPGILLKVPLMGKQSTVLLPRVILNKVANPAAFEVTNHDLHPIIRKGDLCIIETHRPELESGCIVVARISGELRMRYYWKLPGAIVLTALAVNVAPTLIKHGSGTRKATVILGKFVNRIELE